MRCNDNVKMRHLSENIAKNGLLSPVVIASDGVLIDGHRRVKACKALGMKELPAIKHNSNSAQYKDAYFVAAAQDTMQINSNQFLWRYMKKAEIPDYVLTRIKLLEEWLGKKWANEIAFPTILERGHSPSTYQFAMGQYRNATHKRSNYCMRKFFNYCFNVESPYMIKAAIQSGVDAKYLINCVNKSKPLNPKYGDK